MLAFAIFRTFVLKPAVLLEKEWKDPVLRIQLVHRQGLIVAFYRFFTEVRPNR